MQTRRPGLCLIHRHVPLSSECSPASECREKPTPPNAVSFLVYIQTNMPSLIGAVFDTNVLYAALRSRRGASRRLLEHVFEGELTLHLTVPLLLEYEEVLVRERDAIGVQYRDIVIVLAALAEAGTWHEVHYLWRPFVNDPDDAHVLEAATAASCPNLVTFNTKDFSEAPRLGIDVLTPSQFLQRLFQNR